jgi:phospholipid-binding lipoprotein MlaA
MKNFITTWRRLFNYTIGVGVLTILLLTGCAHKGSTRLEPEMSTAAPSANISEVAVTDPESDTISEDGTDDDFFEDEFDSDNQLVADPLMAVNRIIFQFNDKLYFWCLKPVARGYRAVIPEPIRLSIGNLFNHAGTPIRLANHLLQGKFKSAGAEFGKFFVNSTAGLLGLGNPAANFPALNPKKEDLGQTLATYGVGNGFYLVLPIFGPSTLRDTVGLVGDFAFDPITYLRPWYVPTSVRAFDITNRLSFRIGDYETLKSAAIDPYVMFRSAYIQHRQEAISE